MSLQGNGPPCGDSGIQAEGVSTILELCSWDIQSLKSEQQGKSQLESQALEVKCLHLEVMPSTFAHISLTKASHMAMPNIKGQVRSVCA